MTSNILWLHDLRLSDLAQVGGKNSSLGEMIGELSGLGVSVPGGFATTADAFKAFIAHTHLHARISDKLKTVDVEDVPALTAAGAEIRGWVIDAPLQPDLDADIRAAYAKLCADSGAADIAVAVRSSPTAEDPPVVAAAKNNRDALEGLLGGAIVRRMKHAPYAVRRSVMYEIEEQFAELYNQTAHSRTRNTTDISTLSSFHHYFAFSKGLSIPGRIRYRYVDLGEPDAQERLEKIAAKRVQQAICLNTTKSEHDGISSEAVNDFLDSYFNVPSKFER